MEGLACCVLVVGVVTVGGRTSIVATVQGCWLFCGQLQLQVCLVVGCAKRVFGLRDQW